MALTKAAYRREGPHGFFFQPLTAARGTDYFTTFYIGRSELLLLSCVFGFFRDTCTLFETLLPATTKNTLKSILCEVQQRATLSGPGGPLSGYKNESGKLSYRITRPRVNFIPLFALQKSCCFDIGSHPEFKR